MGTWRRRATVGLRLAILLAFVLALNRLGVLVVDHFAIEERLSRMPRRLMLGTALALYVFLMATPFVPGVEIGVALLIVLGPPVALLVWGATVLGLCISYSIGRLVPVEWTCRICRRAGLGRLAVAIERMAAAADQPADPAGAVGLVRRHRWVGLIVLLNLPGNALLGGGGGIAMAAGIGRLYRSHEFLLAVVLATAPVPLAVFFLGA